MPGKKTKKQKKTTKRSKSKYPALDPKLAPKVRKEFIDFDYLHKLDPEDLEYLNKVMEEELHASFKNDETDLNQSQEDKRRVYSNNNARNRDMYAITKASGLLTKIEDKSNQENTEAIEHKSDTKANYSESYNLEEDAMIARLDRKKKD